MISEKSGHCQSMNQYYIAKEEVLVIVGDKHDGIVIVAMRQRPLEPGCSEPFVRINPTSSQAIPSGTSVVIDLSAV